jgi:DNA replication protein DnaC
VLERVEYVRLLVIDDMGKEYRANSGFAETQFGALIRKRTRARKTTLINTNQGLREFQDVYGLSTSELVNECMISIEMKGPNVRDMLAAQHVKK